MPGDMYRHPLARVTRSTDRDRQEVVGTGRFWRLDDGIDAPADEAIKGREKLSLTYRAEVRSTGAAHRFRPTRHRRCRSSGALRIWKYVEKREVGFDHERERVGKLLFGFGWKAGNKIGANDRIGARRTECRADRQDVAPSVCADLNPTQQVPKSSAFGAQRKKKSSGLPKRHVWALK